MVIPPSEWIFKVLDFKQQNGWLLFLLYHRNVSKSRYFGF